MMEKIERKADKKMRRKKAREQRKIDVFANSPAARRKKWTPGLV
mgnify:CR=1 FL=1